MLNMHPIVGIVVVIRLICISCRNVCTWLLKKLMNFFSYVYSFTILFALVLARLIRLLAC